MALGDKGHKLAAQANKNLFAKTEKDETAVGTNEADAPHPQAEAEEETTKPPVKKSFSFSYELNKQLRTYAFVNDKKEIDIVREALERFFAQKGE